MAVRANFEIDANVAPAVKSIQRAAAEINKITNSIGGKGVNFNVNGKSFTQPLGRITASANEFTKSLEASNARVIAFGASVGIINGVTDSFKFLVAETVRFEKTLKDINVVLNASNQQLQQFGQGLFDVAQNTAQGFNVAADAALEFSRQGLSTAEVLKRTNDALTLTRITSLDAAEAVSGLTAAVNAFGKAGLTTTDIIDKLAAVDVKFAVSSEDLINGLERAGAVAIDAGVSLDSLIGIITSLQQTTARGGAVIGNGLKTIFTRIQRPESIRQLEKMDVRVRDLTGSILPADKILKNIAKSFKNLSQAQQSNIVQFSAGIFQANIFRAALSDLSKAQGIQEKALGISANAAGEAARKNELLNQSLSALASRAGTGLKELAGIIGELAIKDDLGGWLDLFGKSIEGLKKSLGGGEDEGSSFAKGLVRGIGNVLTGPGMIAFTVIFTKLLANVFKFAGSSLKDVMGIVSEKEKVRKIEESIVKILGENKDLTQALNNLSDDRVAQEKFVLGMIERQTNALLEQKKLAERLARPLVRQGVNEDLSFTSDSLVDLDGDGIPDTFNASGGVVPRERKKERAGARRGGYTPGAVADMNVPGIGRVVYNKAETIKQFPGMAQPAIMPPQNSPAGQHYKNAFSDKHGFNPYAGSGFVPNFARWGKADYPGRNTKKYSEAKGNWYMDNPASGNISVRGTPFNDLPNYVINQIKKTGGAIGGGNIVFETPVSNLNKSTFFGIGDHLSALGISTIRTELPFDFINYADEYLGKSGQLKSSYRTRLSKGSSASKGKMGEELFMTSEEGGGYKSTAAHDQGVVDAVQEGKIPIEVKAGSISLQNLAEKSIRRYSNQAFRDNIRQLANAHIGSTSRNNLIPGLETNGEIAESLLNAVDQFEEQTIVNNLSLLAKMGEYSFTGMSNEETKSLLINDPKRKILKHGIGDRELQTLKKFGLSGGFVPNFIGLTPAVKSIAAEFNPKNVSNKTHLSYIALAKNVRLSAMGGGTKSLSTIAAEMGISESTISNSKKPSTTSGKAAKEALGKGYSAYVSDLNEIKSNKKYHIQRGLDFENHLLEIFGMTRATDKTAPMDYINNEFEGKDKDLKKRIEMMESTGHGDAYAGPAGHAVDHFIAKAVRQQDPDIKTFLTGRKRSKRILNTKNYRDIIGTTGGKTDDVIKGVASISDIAEHSKNWFRRKIVGAGYPLKKTDKVVDFIKANPKLDNKEITYKYTKDFVDINEVVNQISKLDPGNTKSQGLIPNFASTTLYRGTSPRYDKIMDDIPNPPQFLFDKIMAANTKSEFIEAVKHLGISHSMGAYSGSYNERARTATLEELRGYEKLPENEILHGGYVYPRPIKGGWGKQEGVDITPKHQPSGFVSRTVDKDVAMSFAKALTPGYEYDPNEMGRVEERSVSNTRIFDQEKLEKYVDRFGLENVKRSFKEGMRKGTLKDIYLNLHKFRPKVQSTDPLDMFSPNAGESERSIGMTDGSLTSDEKEITQIWSKRSPYFGSNQGLVPNFSYRMAKGIEWQKHASYGKGFDEGTYGKSFIGETIKNQKKFLLAKGHPFFSNYMGNQKKKLWALKQATFSGKDIYWPGAHLADLEAWGHLPNEEAAKSAAQRVADEQKKNNQYRDEMLNGKWEDVSDVMRFVSKTQEVRYTGALKDKIVDKLGKEYSHISYNAKRVEDYAKENKIFKEQSKFGLQTKNPYPDTIRAINQIADLPAQKIKDLDVIRPRGMSEMEMEQVRAQSIANQIKWDVRESASGKKEYGIRANGAGAFPKFMEFLAKKGIPKRSIDNIQKKLDAKNAAMNEHYNQAHKNYGASGRAKQSAGLAYDAMSKDQNRITTDGLYIKNLASLIKEYNESYANQGLVPNFADISKIRELAIRGRGGEKTNAQRMLKKFSIQSKGMFDDMIIDDFLRNPNMSYKGPWGDTVTDYLLSKGYDRDQILKAAKKPGSYTRAAIGLIPNFSNPLRDAISREKSAGIPENRIRVSQDDRLRGPKNPMGLGVINTRDEPLGIGQGIRRAKEMGINPKSHGASQGLVPNFADPVNLDEIRKSLVSNLKKIEKSFGNVNMVTRIFKGLDTDDVDSIEKAIDKTSDLIGHLQEGISNLETKAQSGPLTQAEEKQLSGNKERLEKIKETKKNLEGAKAVASVKTTDDFDKHLEKLIKAINERLKDIEQSGSADAEQEHKKILEERHNLEREDIKLSEQGMKAKEGDISKLFFMSSMIQMVNGQFQELATSSSSVIAGFGRLGEGIGNVVQAQIAAKEVSSQLSSAMGVDSDQSFSLGDLNPFDSSSRDAKNKAFKASEMEKARKGKAPKGMLGGLLKSAGGLARGFTRFVPILGQAYTIFQGVNSALKFLSGTALGAAMGLEEGEGLMDLLASRASKAAKNIERLGKMSEVASAAMESIDKSTEAQKKVTDLEVLGSKRTLKQDTELMRARLELMKAKTKEVESIANLTNKQKAGASGVKFFTEVLEDAANSGKSIRDALEAASTEMSAFTAMAQIRKNFSEQTNNLGLSDGQEEFSSMAKIAGAGLAEFIVPLINEPGKSERENADILNKVMLEVQRIANMSASDIDDSIGIDSIDFSKTGISREFVAEAIAKELQRFQEDTTEEDEYGLDANKAFKAGMQILAEQLKARSDLTDDLLDIAESTGESKKVHARILSMALSESKFAAERQKFQTSMLKLDRSIMSNTVSSLKDNELISRADAIRAANAIKLADIQTDLELKRAEATREYSNTLVKLNAESLKVENLISQEDKASLEAATNRLKKGLEKSADALEGGKMLDSLTEGLSEDAVSRLKSMISTDDIAEAQEKLNSLAANVKDGVETQEHLNNILRDMVEKGKHNVALLMKLGLSISETIPVNEDSTIKYREAITKLAQNLDSLDKNNKTEERKLKIATQEELVKAKTLAGAKELARRIEKEVDLRKTIEKNTLGEIATLKVLNDANKERAKIAKKSLGYEALIFERLRRQVQDQLSSEQDTSATLDQQVMLMRLRRPGAVVRNPGIREAVNKQTELDALKVKAELTNLQKSRLEAQDRNSFIAIWKQRNFIANETFLTEKANQENEILNNDANLKLLDNKKNRNDVAARTLILEVQGIEKESMLLDSKVELLKNANYRAYISQSQVNSELKQLKYDKELEDAKFEYALHSGKLAETSGLTAEQETLALEREAMSLKLKEDKLKNEKELISRQTRAQNLLDVQNKLIEMRNAQISASVDQGHLSAMVDADMQIERAGQRGGLRRSATRGIMSGRPEDILAFTEGLKEYNDTVGAGTKAIDQLRIRMAEMSVSASNLGSDLVDIGIDGARSGMVELFKSIGSGAKSASEAWEDFSLGVAESLLDRIMQNNVDKIINDLTYAFTGIDPVEEANRFLAQNSDAVTLNTAAIEKLIATYADGIRSDTAPPVGDRQAILARIERLIAAIEAKHAATYSPKPKTGIGNYHLGFQKLVQTPADIIKSARPRMEQSANDLVDAVTRSLASVTSKVEEVNEQAQKALAVKQKQEQAKLIDQQFKGAGAEMTKRLEAGHSGIEGVKSELWASYGSKSKGKRRLDEIDEELAQLSRLKGKEYERHWAVPTPYETENESNIRQWKKNLRAWRDQQNKKKFDSNKWFDIYNAPGPLGNRDTLKYRDGRRIHGEFLQGASQQEIDRLSKAIAKEKANKVGLGVGLSSIQSDLSKTGISSEERQSLRDQQKKTKEKIQAINSNIENLEEEKAWYEKVYNTGTFWIDYDKNNEQKQDELRKEQERINNELNDAQKAINSAKVELLNQYRNRAEVLTAMVEGFNSGEAPLTKGEYESLYTEVQNFNNTYGMQLRNEDQNYGRVNMTAPNRVNNSRFRTKEDFAGPPLANQLPPPFDTSKLPPVPPPPALVGQKEVGLSLAMDPNVQGLKLALEANTSAVREKNVKIYQDSLDDLGQILGKKFWGGRIQKFAEGGFVNGPAGKDQVPAMLTAGEYVVPKDEVQKFNKGTGRRGAGTTGNWWEEGWFGWNRQNTDNRMVAGLQAVTSAVTMQHASRLMSDALNKRQDKPPTFDMKKLNQLNLQSDVSMKRGDPRLSSKALANDPVMEEYRSYLMDKAAYRVQKQNEKIKKRKSRIGTAVQTAASFAMKEGVNKIVRPMVSKAREAVVDWAGGKWGDYSETYQHLRKSGFDVKYSDVRESIESGKDLTFDRVVNGRNRTYTFSPKKTPFHDQKGTLEISNIEGGGIGGNQIYADGFEWQKWGDPFTNAARLSEPTRPGSAEEKKILKNLEETYERKNRGGLIPSMLTAGEGFIPASIAKRIGYGNLDTMNKTGSLPIVQGPGGIDKVGPVGLSEGDFIIRKSSTDKLMRENPNMMRFALQNPDGFRRGETGYYEGGIVGTGDFSSTSMPTSSASSTGQPVNRIQPLIEAAEAQQKEKATHSQNNEVTNNINVSVTIDSSGNETVEASSPKESYEQEQELAMKIKSKVLEVIREEKRLGGELDR